MDVSSAPTIRIVSEAPGRCQCFSIAVEYPLQAKTVCNGLSSAVRSRRELFSAKTSAGGSRIRLKSTKS